MSPVVEQSDVIHSRSKAYAAAGFAALIAAGTFLVAKGTTEVFSPTELGWFRITLSFLIIFTVLRVKSAGSGVSLKPGKEHIPHMIGMGLLGVTTNQLLFLHGMHLASPIDGALIYAFTPVCVLLFARIFLGEAIKWGKVFGITIAISGVVLVLRERGLDLSSDHLRGDLIIVGAMVSWAGYTILGKKMMVRYGAILTNTWVFGFGALSVLPLGFYVLPDFDWSGPGVGGWIGLFYLSAITSVVSFTLWTYALKALEASQVSVFTNLQPALTALLTWIFLGEIPTMMVIFGMLLVILGVSLTQKR